MAQRTVVITLIAVAALVAAGATALFAGPGAAAAVCGVALVGVVAAGLLLAARSRAEAQATAAVVSGLAKALTGGEAPATALPAALAPELVLPLEALHSAGTAAARYVGLVGAFVKAFAEGTVAEATRESYPGPMGRSVEHMNAIVSAMQMRNADLKKLLDAGNEGRFDVRADVSKYSGYNGRLLTMVGDMIAAIHKPIREATTTLERLARRDLTARMTGTYPGEYARLQGALNGTAQDLHDALSQVAQSSSQVSSAAGEIASSSQSVAAGAAQQASSLEESSASLESMATMLKSSADNAQQASALAQTAKGVAGQGADAMQEMAGAMESIRASAEGTSQIIKDINEIAFQTNLLALNAAVEAARAGAAGRGFAVVAEEVRSLALRSKEAANKTEALIRESVRQTGEGDQTAKLVAGKLSEITNIVGKVSDIIGEIAAASREQATGVEQATRAVGEMNKITQQNAANSEQSSSAAVELSSQAEELTALVGGFKLAGATQPGAIARAAATRAPKPAGRPEPKKAAPAPRHTLAAAKALARPAPKPVARTAPAKPVGKAAKNGAHVGNGIPVKPEEIIPLDGDPTFDDF